MGSPVFKTGGGSRCGPRWVRPPSTPACILILVLLDYGLLMLSSPDIDNLSLLFPASCTSKQLPWEILKKASLPIIGVRYLALTAPAHMMRLAALLKPFQITPLFRIENNQHAVILIPGIPNPRPSKSWVNILFSSSLFSAFFSLEHCSLIGVPT